MLIEIIVAMLLSLVLLGSLLKPVASALKASSVIRLKQTAEQSVCQTVSERDRILLEKCLNAGKSEFLRLREKNSSGFSLPEILLALFLSLSLFITISKTFGTAIIQARLSEKQSESMDIALRISSEIRRLTALSNQHPFSIEAIVHKAGLIRLRNGAGNSVMSGNPKLRPDTKSDALTNLDLVPEELLDINNCSQNDTFFQGSACLRFKESAALSQYQSFILYSADGFSEGLGKLSGNGKCRTFELKTGQSMIFEQAIIQERCNLIALIPIEAIQTIYQSVTGDFRLITHRLEENMENQPLSKTFPSISLTLNTNSDGMRLGIADQQQIFRIEQINLLFKKNSGLNFLLNKT